MKIVVSIAPTTKVEARAITRKTVHQKIAKFDLDCRLINCNAHTKFGKNQMKTVVSILPTTNVDEQTDGQTKNRT